MEKTFCNGFIPAVTFSAHAANHAVSGSYGKNASNTFEKKKRIRKYPVMSGGNNELEKIVTCKPNIDKISSKCTRN
ncbi:hypothetical protein ACFL0H_12180 [Thermodesulfobacteriota bacterium]